MELKSNIPVFHPFSNSFAGAENEFNLELANTNGESIELRLSEDIHKEKETPNQSKYFQGYALSFERKTKGITYERRDREGYRALLSNKLPKNINDYASIREIPAGSGKKVILAYSESRKKVDGFVLDQTGQLLAVKPYDMPGELQYIPNVAIFEAFLRDAYVQARNFSNGDISLSIQQRARGGMKEQLKEVFEKYETLASEEQTAILKKLLKNKNYKNLDEKQKLALIQKSFKIYEQLKPEKRLFVIEKALNSYDRWESEEERYLILTKALEIIDSAHLELKEKHESVVLFLGQTGSGKSTLINYLAGAQIRGKWDDDGEGLQVHNMLEDIKIGHGYESCTFAPAPYVHKESGLVYFDCPGFLDSRGIIHEIINVKLIQAVVKNANTVQFVLTIEESILDQKGLKDLKEAIDSLESYAKDFKQFQDSMCLVIAKGANNKRKGKPGDETDDIRYFNTKVKKILDEVELTEYQSEFLKFIKDQNRFKYTFKKGTEDGERVSQIERESINQFLKDIVSIPRQKDFDIKVSPKAQLCVIKLAQHVNRYIQKLLKVLGSGIEAYYRNRIKGCEERFEDHWKLQADAKHFFQVLDEFSSSDAYQNITDCYEKLKQILNENKIIIDEKILLDIEKQNAALSLFKKINTNLRVDNIEGWKNELNEMRKSLSILMDSECNRLKQQDVLKPLDIKAGDAPSKNEKAAAVHLEAAKKFIEHKEIERAQKEFKKALECTDVPDVYKEYAHFIATFEKENKQKVCRVFYELGQLYKKQEKWAEAKESYKQSLHWMALEAPLIALAELCKNLRNPKEAADYLSQIGQLYEKNGGFEPAIKAYEEAFEVSKDSRLLQQLFKLYNHQKDTGKALERKQQFFDLALNAEGLSKIKRYTLLKKQKDFLKEQKQDTNQVNQALRILKAEMEMEEKRAQNVSVVPFKYFENRSNLEFAFLGSGAFNTVKKVTITTPSGEKRSEVLKPEVPLLFDGGGLAEILGIDPNDPKICFRNILYSEMSYKLRSVAEALGLGSSVLKELDIVPHARLGIHDGKLYTAMALAEGSLAAGRESTVQILPGSDLANQLNSKYGDWINQGKQMDWQTYVKLERILDNLKQYSMNSIEEPLGSGSNLRWYGTALVPHEPAIDLNDPNLHAALASMQLLDLLLFQLDRNLNNFFIKTDAHGKFEKLTTIDNDFCISSEYLDKEKLQQSPDRLEKSVASSLRFPVWVSPEVAAVYLNLQDKDMDTVFNQFQGIFGVQETNASKQMLATIKAHLETIKSNSREDFLKDRTSQLARLRNGLKEVSRKVELAKGLENQNIKTTWEELKTAHASIEAIKQKYVFSAEERGAGITSLHKAVLAEDLEAIRLLLYAKEDIEAKTDIGKTPLHIAVEAGKEKAVELLLKERAYSTSKDNNGQMPIHLAAIRGNPNLIQLLFFEDRSCIYEKDDKGQSPLHLAATNGQYENFNKLLELEANQMGRGKYLNDKDKEGATILHLAAKEGYLRLVSLISNNRHFNLNAVDNDGRTPLHQAANSKNPKVVEELIEAFPTAEAKKLYVETKDKNGKTAFDEASTLEYLDIVEKLRMFCGYSNATVQTPLNHGPNMNAENNQQKLSLQSASERGDSSSKIERGKSLNPSQNRKDNAIPSSISSNDTNTALHIAVQQGNIETINALLSGRYNINAKNKDGYTALHYAAHHGKIEAVKFLIDKGADINLKNKDGYTALHYAATNGQLEIVQCLISKNLVIISAKNNKGYTALHYAATNGYLAIVQCLVDKKPNAVNDENAGSTVLHYAAVKGYLEIVQYLISQKADVNAKNGAGKTPLDLARENNHKDTSNILATEEKRLKLEDPSKGSYSSPSMFLKHFLP